MEENIAVLGAGNAGYAFSVYLTQRGHNVTLYESDKFRENIDPIIENDGIQSFGELCGFTKIKKVTTNMSEALDDAKLIIVPVPAFAQDFIFEKMIPHLQKGQIILLTPDNTGSIRLFNLLKKKNMENKVTICGSASMLFVAKRSGLAPGQVNIDGIKNIIRIASMPAKKIDDAKDTLANVFDKLKFNKNVLENSLSNFNHQLHPAPILLNAGRVESKEAFYFYKEGHTSSIDKVLKQIDEEKINIGRSLGYEIEPFEDIFQSYYKGRCAETDDINEMINSNLCYRNVLSPSSMKSRFIIEDIKYGLVLMSSIGERFNIKTPIIDSIINISSVLNGSDYMSEGITLDKLGFKNMNPKEINDYLQEGK